MNVLGIDIGGSGIKAAPVDVERGELLAERRRVETPPAARIEDVVEEVRGLVEGFGWNGPVGCTFPAVIEQGVALTAVNVHDDWKGAHVTGLLRESLGLPVAVLNDADAAGIAEMRFGAGRGRDGVVVVLTLGTGIGTAMFFNGELVPNTELAHLEIGGKDAEELAAGRLVKEDGLSWEKWAARLNIVLSRMEMLVRPNLFVIGGGVSKNHEAFVPLLATRAQVLPAALRNDAGIVGAAYFACHVLSPERATPPTGGLPFEPTEIASCGAGTPR